MQIRSISRFTFGLALLAVIAISGVSINAVEAPRKIRILYTDDLMGEWKPCG